MRTIGVVGCGPESMHGWDEGARALYAADSARVRDALSALVGPDGAQVLTDGSQGAAQLAFWCADDLKRSRPGVPIANSLLLPCRGQAARWRSDGCFNRWEHASMVAVADSVDTLGDDGAPASLDAVDDAVAKRCDALLVVRRPSEASHGRVGRAEAAARRRGVDVTVLLVR